jgi:hypothetical protein
MWPVRQMSGRVAALRSAQGSKHELRARVYGRLWELDGSSAGPIDHGPSSREALLRDAAQVARKFIAASDSLNFTMLALAAPEQQ